MSNIGFHEDFSRSHGRRSSSDRQFGLVIAGAFTVFALWPLHRAESPRWWLFVGAVLLLTVALAKPGVLHPLNILWTRLGILLGRILNPITMAIFYFAVFTPLSLIVRLLRKDPLELRFDPQSRTYWNKRQPAVLDMTRQF